MRQLGLFSNYLDAFLWYNHKDDNRTKIENHKYTCITKVNWIVRNCILQLTFVYWVKNYSSHQSHFVYVHYNVPLGSIHTCDLLGANYYMNYWLNDRSILSRCIHTCYLVNFAWTEKFAQKFTPYQSQVWMKLNCCNLKAPPC